MPHINLNGKIFTNDTPVITANNRGFKFGDGIFETIKIKNDKLILEDEHFARLWKGLQVLQFTIPKHITPDKLQEEILFLAKKNNHNNLGRIRLTVFRSNGGLFDAVDNLPNYIIETWQLPPESEQLNSNGLDIGIYRDVKKNCDILSNLKHNNYLPNVMAGLNAKNNKWNDAVLLNNFSRVCETTIANIFLIKDEIIYTPSLSEGCVAGIMRKYVIEQLKVNGFNCIEKQITVDELLNADEVFLTNSIKKMQWIKNFDEKNYRSNLVSKIYNLLK